ncbi:MAG: hypothetical protein Q7J28_10180 [Caulobacter sp.]|nr:hypothetical protein [Caulobacter sp.]
MSFLDLVTREAADLMAAHNLEPVGRTPADALLVGPSYSLWFQSDRDGVSLTYVEVHTGEPRGFDLFSYLWRRRHDQLAFASERPDQENEVEAAVQSLVRHLRSAGRDILSGEKAWQMDYGLPPSNLPELKASITSGKSM